MKIFSDNVVTLDDLNKIDKKQNLQLEALKLQIEILKLAIAGSFLLSVMITVGLCFWLVR